MPRTPRQMHGRRALAAAAAAGLLFSLFAPWYRETVVARGVTGLRTLTLTRSGWQAFSATELSILVVAVLTLLVLVGVPSGVPEPGAPDRRRLRGAVVAALGAIAFVIVLARLTTAPGTTRHTLDETMVAIRWGIFLALAASAGLIAAGLRLTRASRPVVAAERPRRAGRRPPTDRPARRERAPRPRSDRLPRQDRASAPDRAGPAATRSDGGDPPAAPSRRADRRRATRRSDRLLWDEQAGGWLDLPD